MREDHPLLLGMSGFWGTPVCNEKCRTADLILAVGTRLLPTVIQAFMEDAPTPGHWQIHDIFRKGD